MSMTLEVPVCAEAEADLLSVLTALTELIHNERIRAFNAGFDEGKKAQSAAMGTKK
jgi:predicted lipoprotein